jgi:peptidyl-tRNA hydrolase, PTH1 family
MKYLLCGLGNPGPRYAMTRHNIGAEALTLLAQKYKAWPPDHAQSSFSVGEDQFHLLWPTLFMNQSGQPIHDVYQEINPDQLVVFHDELDFQLGRVEIKRGGSSGGHNGLKSVEEYLGRDFTRVRIGVGRPKTTEGPIIAAYVLSKFQSVEKPRRMGLRAVSVYQQWLKDC